jgi:hypothetical protein
VEFERVVRWKDVQPVLDEMQAEFKERVMKKNVTERDADFIRGMYSALEELQSRVTQFINKQRN